MIAMSVDKISPSQINKFIRCRFQWYSKYVLNLPEPTNFYFERGTLVHNICEAVIRFEPSKAGGYKTVGRIATFLRGMAKDMIAAKWPEIAVQFPEATKYAKKETLEMAKNFIRIIQGRASSNAYKFGAARSWNMAKPNMAEIKLKSERLGLTGRADSVTIKEGTDGEKITVLSDYKTSKVYLTPHSDEYYRQVILYALMWNDEKGRPPDLCTVDYLVSGESIAYPITSQTLADAETITVQARRAMEATAALAPLEVHRNVTKMCKYCCRYQMCREDGFVK